MIKNTKKAQKNNILSLEDVSISYGKFEAVKNIFCNFKKGDITSLIGPSGCGCLLYTSPSPRDRG